MSISLANMSNVLLLMIFQFFKRRPDGRLERQLVGWGEMEGIKMLLQVYEDEPEIEDQTGKP